MATREYINYQVQKPGFGAYLQDILPSDVAVTAGAFSASMQNIKNITKIDFEKFAQVAQNIETTANLPSINGSNVPVDVTLAQEAHTLTALGSGPYGTYTMSDFFGCMSGLPYQWESMQSQIIDLQSTKLQNIYQELYLGIYWLGATITVTYTTYTGPGPSFLTYYTVTGVTLTDGGGGYGRGGATAPTISILGGSGATAVATIGTDPSDLSTYGKVTNITLTSAGTDVTTAPSATIQFPPTATLPVQSGGSKATGGTNTASGTVGWASPMESVVAAYITQANTEIGSLASVYPVKTRNLNTIYDAAGLQLRREQRARFTGIPPVPSINLTEPPGMPTTGRDDFLNLYPISQLTFIDSIPFLAQKTLPHMSAQTLEAISDFSFVGGQSLVGLMREARNETRLNLIGVSQDNNIPDTLSNEEIKIPSINGTLNTAEEGIDIKTPIIIDPSVQNQGTVFTLPAILKQSISGQNIEPKPAGYYNPVQQKLNLTKVTDSINPIQQLINYENNYTGTGDLPVTIIQTGTKTGTGIGIPEDTGQAIFPGSLAGSRQSNLVSPNLKVPYIQGTLLPADYDVNQAIDEVIRCNCDCWID